MSQGRFLLGGPLNTKAFSDSDKEAVRVIAQELFLGVKERADRTLSVPQAATFVNAYLKANDSESVTAVLDDIIDERYVALNKKTEVRKTRRNAETYRAEAVATADHMEAVTVRTTWLGYLDYLHCFYDKELTFREIVDSNQLF